MRCHEEQFVKEAIFHIYNRAIDEVKLFGNDADYHYFMQKLKKLTSGNEIYAYCLMPNHFHLCIQQKSDSPVYKTLNSIITSYAMHYNRKYKRRGKLFAGKLQHKLIIKNNYLLQLCKYIHYNPVKAGLVSNVSDWEYSNYHEYVGTRNDMFSSQLLEMFPGEFEDYASTVQEYEKYLEEIKPFIID